METYWISVQAVENERPRKHRVIVFPQTPSIANSSVEIIDGETYAWLRDNIRAAIESGDVIVRPGWFGGFYVHLVH